MHRKPPPRIVSVYISEPMAKSQRTGAPKSTTAPAKSTPPLFKSITSKRPRKGASLSNLLADIAAVARVRKLREAGVPV